MSKRPDAILLSDEEDTCIVQHTMEIEAVKEAKAEHQRVWEEEERQRQAKEAEAAWKKAEEAKKKCMEEVERQRKQEEAWKKSEEVAVHKRRLILLLKEHEEQRVQETAEWRASEVGVGMGGRILGYGKGKTLEKRVCRQCL